jgi:hypothetical protein
VNKNKPRILIMIFEQEISRLHSHSTRYLSSSFKIPLEVAVVTVTVDAGSVIVAIVETVVRV